MFIHLKIYKIIFVSFPVFPLEYTDAFWIFLLLFAMFDMFFLVNIFPHFYDQIKHKAGSRFHPTKTNKPMETLQAKQS